MLDRRQSNGEVPPCCPISNYDLSVPIAAPTEELIAEAGRCLRLAAPGSEVLLFGSHARGEANPRSDVDFLVIEPEVANEAEESVRLLRALEGLRIPADVVVISRDYAEAWRDVPGGLVHAALSHGRVLVGP
jgi:uncharacterized protein